MRSSRSLNTPVAPVAEAQQLIRTLTVLALLALALLLVEASPARAEPESLWEAPGAPLLRLHAVDEGPHAPSADAALAPRPALAALMLETRLELSVSGLLARGTLTQRFRNPGEDWREAEYLLPLPPDAAVMHFELEVDERRIVGEIRERAEARQVYDQARRAGKRSALLEQQRPHLFTTRVANIPPGEEITVRVELQLPVRYRDGEFSLRFPTTLTPVYIPGLPVTGSHKENGQEAARERISPWLSLSGAGWASATDAVPDAPLLTALQQPAGAHLPRNPFALAVDLRPGLALSEVEALYHDLQIERRSHPEGDHFSLSFRDGVAEMDRDLVLRWRPQASAKPQAAVFRERFNDEEYAMLMVVPPQLQATPGARLPRELLLLVDVSGSMQGESIRRAQESLLFAIGTLQPGDFVNVMAFSEQVSSLYREPRAVDARTLREARRFVEKLDARGGTEMLPALQAALRQPPPLAGDPERRPLRQLLFMTDGAVGNESALLELVAAEVGDTRLFAVGIGSAPNSYLLQEAAALGRGQALYVANPQDVAESLGGLFRRLEAPMARELEVDWPAAAEVFPDKVPDLYAGEPLLQVARMPGLMESAAVYPGEPVIAVSGELADRVWTQQLALPAQSTDDGVATHWARQKIASLMTEARGDRSDPALRAAVLPLALRFSLASPFTSFVALEEAPARPAAAPLRPAAVANTLPKGHRGQQFAFAQGATTALAQLYLGVFALFIAMLVWVMTRPECDR